MVSTVSLGWIWGKRCSKLCWLFSESKSYDDSKMVYWKIQAVGNPELTFLKIPNNLKKIFLRGWDLKYFLPHPRFTYEELKHFVFSLKKIVYRRGTTSNKFFFFVASSNPVQKVVKMNLFFMRKTNSPFEMNYFGVFWVFFSRSSLESILQGYSNIKGQPKSVTPD